MNLYALILAGGEGKRFWPLSRKDRPKQFLSLIGEKSMIRQTVDRILPLIPIERVFVVTLERYGDETLKHIPELPAQNLILEPVGKNTAPAIAIGALKIKKTSPDAVMVVLPADHAIGREEAFREVLAYANKIAATGLSGEQYPLITLGLKPVRPETGYGYIKEGDTVKESDKHQIRRVAKFIEKPGPAKAVKFLKEGGYYWNSGIFIWKATTILGAFKKLLPHWSTSFQKILDGMGTSNWKSCVNAFYQQVEGGPIDKLILEKWEDSLVIPIDFPWSDIGSWQALDEFLRTDEIGNVFRGEGTSVDSSSCLVFGEKRMIAIVGVKDLVVVETDQAILVLDKKKAQDVKKVVETLEKKGKLL